MAAKSKISYKMDADTQRVVDLFEKISAIPRKSGNEAKVREFMADWAKGRGYEYVIDKVGNILIKVPATGRMGRRPTIVLQGHLDMVCEKTPKSKHDFSKDPIKFVFDGEWLRADNTTLGADNGIAMAMAMALVEDPNIKHPNLELLFTTEEETGLTGASGLKKNFLSGKYLINIDSENDEVFTVGCAGGKDTDMSMPLEYEEVPNDYTALLIKVGGCAGGHSGENIKCQRANAIRVLSRILQCIREVSDMRLVGITGGSAHNAIPRDAEAGVFVPVAQLKEVKNLVNCCTGVIKDEFVTTDPNMFVSCEEVNNTQDRRAMLSYVSLKAVDFLRAIPHGVSAFSTSIPGLVETSSNLAIVSVRDGKLHVKTSSRSSVLSRRDAIVSRIESVGRLVNAEIKSGNGYVPWQPDFDSDLIKKCRTVYKKVLKKEPRIEVIHAGLECGLIGAKHKGMQMISVGPNIRNCHSPEEKIELPSIAKIYKFLTRLLQELQ
jgi:dipeptidase D